MESVFVKILGEFGIVPVMVLLIMVVWFLLREIKKEVGSVKGSVQGLKDGITDVRDELMAKLQELKERSDEKDKELQKAMDELELRMLALEKDSVSKEQMYRLVSGWRSEISNLNDLIVKGLGVKNEK